MYVKERKKLTHRQVASYLSKSKTSSPWSVNDILNLNDAIIKGRSVFAVCDKFPSRGLDYGKHYYSIYYVNKAGIVCHFWFPPFMDEQNRSLSIPKYGFSSGVIGMSRLLDATDHLFRRLEEMGGTYVQLERVL
jgi:hypothetical protein